MDEEGHKCKQHKHVEHETHCEGPQVFNGDDKNPYLYATFQKNQQKRFLLLGMNNIQEYLDTSKNPSKDIQERLTLFRKQFRVFSPYNVDRDKRNRSAALLQQVAKAEKECKYLESYQIKIDRIQSVIKMQGSNRHLNNSKVDRNHDPVYGLLTKNLNSSHHLLANIYKRKLMQSHIELSEQQSENHKFRMVDTRMYDQKTEVTYKDILKQNFIQNSDCNQINFSKVAEIKTDLRNHFNYTDILNRENMDTNFKVP